MLQTHGCITLYYVFHIYEKAVSPNQGTDTRLALLLATSKNVIIACTPAGSGLYQLEGSVTLAQSSGLIT